MSMRVACKGASSGVFGGSIRPWSDKGNKEKFFVFLVDKTPCSIAVSTDTAVTFIRHCDHTYGLHTSCTT